MLTYEQALRVIFSRSDFERGVRPPYGERVWRLERVNELLSAVGDPQRRYHAVHVAGTKGKGSTSAMIDAMLRAAGYCSGLYTSPHLHTFRERIRLDGESISEADLIAVVEELQPVLAARPEVTVFEIITALAMMYFAEQGVDWGVFEVGMGGRLDATNILRPEVAVITSISLDHVNVLGHTLAAIAGEKAGIIKPGVPVVSAPQRPEALEVVAATAAECGAPLVLAGRDWLWRILSEDLDGQRLDLYRPGHEATPEYAEVHLPLLGAHQAENAAVAVAAAEVLREGGAEISREAVRRGLETVEWPGRLEILSREPLVVVDGAHNPYSIGRLLEALELFGPRRLLLVFGAGQGHNPGELLTLAAPYAERVWTVQAPHPKAASAAELAAVASEAGCPAEAAPSVGAALQAAVAAATPGHLVLATGSLFVVAAAKEAWAAMNGLPLPPADPPGVY
jgi:dihydrofolate synthase/folylpolyglutamate synthase